MLGPVLSRERARDAFRDSNGQRGQRDSAASRVTLLPTRAGSPDVSLQDVLHNSSSKEPVLILLLLWAAAGFLQARTL